jgi:hypothetical protein
VIVKSKKTSCYGCSLNKNGYCYWFQPHPKIIPHNIIDKGCKYRKPAIDKIYTTKTVKYIVDKFNGELINGK